MERLRQVIDQGWCVRLDLTHQVLHLDVPERVWERGDDAADGRLAPTCPRDASGFVSAALLLHKAKQFDDGLYAAVEGAAQAGAGHFAGKASLLAAVAQALAAEGDAADPGALALVFGACELGGLPGEPPAAARAAVRASVAAFLRDERLSKPLGFYTWTDGLRAIFRQDRFLQAKVRQ